MSVKVYETVNFYGRTVWRVMVGPHFLGSFSTKEEAESASQYARRKRV
jgi:hypothetical protein